MPKRIGKLAKVLEKQAIQAEQVMQMSSAVAGGGAPEGAAPSIISPMAPASMGGGNEDKGTKVLLAAIAGNLSDKGDIFKQLKKLSYSFDGLTSAMLGKGAKVGKSGVPTASVDTTEGENEAIKRDEHMTALLEEIAGNTRPKIDKSGVKKDDPAVGIGGILTLLAAGLGALVGYIKGYVKAVKLIMEALMPEKAIAAIKESFSKVVKFFGNIGTYIAEQFGKLKSMFSFEGESKIGKVIEGIKGAVTKFFEPITQAWKTIKEASTPVQKAIDFFGDFIGKIKSFFGGIGQSAAGFGKIFGAVANVFAKLALPLTVIMAIWDTVKGAIEGFEKEGIIGGIKGAITGLIDSLITGPLDMLKGAVSWILEKFGFGEAAKFLDSFNFGDMMKSYVDAIFSPIETIKSMFNGVMSFLEGITIPEIGFTIPIINKKVSVGPFQPFKKEGGGSAPAAPAGAPAAAKTGGGEAVASNAPKTALPAADAKQNASADAKAKADYAKASPEEKAKIEKITGKTAAELSGATAGPALSSSKVEPNKIGSIPSTSGNEVAAKSSETEMAKQPTQQSGGGAIIAPSSTVVNNSNSTYAMKSPIRNNDPGLNRYLANKYA